jgi:hypothetical protein
VAAIKAFGHDSQPNHVDQEEHGQSDDVQKQKLFCRHIALSTKDHKVSAELSQAVGPLAAYPFCHRKIGKPGHDWKIGPDQRRQR